MATATIDIENLGPWSAPKEVNTKNGPMRLRSFAIADGSGFWDVYRGNKQALKSAGVSVGQWQGKWQASWWIPLSKEDVEERKEQVEKSWAEDSDMDIPCPEGLSYLPYQRAGIDYASKRECTLLADSMGLGKAQPLAAGILTPSGWMTMGDMRVGMEIIGSDGMPHSVTGVFPQGVKPVYNVTFTDGVVVQCCGDHLWHVRDDNHRKRGTKGVVLSVNEMLKRGIARSARSHKLNCKYEIPKLSPIQFSQKTLPIHPYVLGVLIGDGCLVNSSPMFSTPDFDIDIVNRVIPLLGDEQVVSSRDTGGCRQYLIAGTKHKHNPMLNAVRNLKINVRSGDKFIPGIYMLGSIVQRTELLRGLMDTDGTCSKNRTSFSTTSAELARNVSDLVRSLGGAASTRRWDRRAKGKGIEYSVRIKTDFCPFHSERKSASWSRDHRAAGRRIMSIEYAGEVEQQCISVSAPDKLYVTDGYKLTHNTVQAIGLANVMAQSGNLKQVLVVCPSSLRLNWEREWKKWSTEKQSIHVVRSGKPESWSSANVIIINFDVVKKHRDAIDKLDIDLLVVDECHNLRNPKTARTMAVLGSNGKGGIKARRRVFLTGTPICNRPIELWTLLQSLTPNGLGSNFMGFAKRYCAAKQVVAGNRLVWDFSGASNLSELQERLRREVMIRRLKEDVLKDLPKKRRQVIEIPSDGIKEVSAEAKAFQQREEYIAKLQAEVDIAKAEGQESYELAVAKLGEAMKVAFSEVSKYRHDTAVAKIPFVVEHVKDALESGPVILFAYHVDVIDALMSEFPGAVRVTGDTPLDARQEAVDKFQSGKSDLFIGNILAAGVGLTLTRSCHVVFAELDWVPGNVTQAEDRAHRIGQDNSVLVQHLVFADSIDVTMAHALIKKQDVIDRALDKDGGEVIVPVRDKVSRIQITTKEIDRDAPSISKEQIEAIHVGLRMIAAACDGAAQLDGMGFNKIDSHIGRSLAMRHELTAKQAVIGRKLVNKYRRQLPDDVVQAAVGKS